jgi:hypothetical protein
MPEGDPAVIGVGTLHTLIGIALLAHGLITSAIGLGAATNPSGAGMALPSWFDWWPGSFGRSWLVETLSLGTGAAIVGGLIWVSAGVLLVAGSLGWLGIGFFEAVRFQLLLSGAAISLLALVLYFHPLYLLAAGINVAIVAITLAKVFAPETAA